MGTATLDDVKNTISDQHEQVKSLINAVQDSDPSQRLSAFKELRTFLAVHEAVEEVCVHPPAKAALPSEEDHVVDERTEEEEEAGGLISELEQMDAGSAGFAAKFDKLGSAVVEHAEAEEHEELPLLQGRASTEDLATMHDALLRVPQMVAASNRDVAFKKQLQATKAELQAS